jgi:uncharacterized Ntn-hydrolase superfamily protein
VTFSIVAWDERDGVRPEWGVAVASKFLAVGSAVAWARAGAGAVATQALANVSYGPDGLHLLRRGHDAETVVRELTQADDGREHRQLGVVDAQGRAATYTGSECFDWAGGVTGDGYCCQGNILTGSDVVSSMASAFEGTSGALVERLLAGLTAGDDAGGDRRGKQSAAVYVVREGAGYGGTIDIAVDLRVDDHPDPVPELQRLLGLQRLYFPDADSLEFVDIDDELAAELRRRLEIGEGRGYDEALREGLYAYVGTENLEERWSEGPRIEVEVLRYVREHT